MQAKRLLRRLFQLIGILLALEIVTLVGLLFYRRMERKPRNPRFPHPPLDPVQVGQHHLTIYNWGEDVFAAMLGDINRAERRILLETYIFRADEVGNSFRKRLVRQAQRGRGVYVIFDGLGSLALPQRFRRFPHNIHTFEFGPLRGLGALIQLRSPVRTHRKILVVDEQVAYLGGLNIGKEYRRRWRDTHLRIEGPVARNVAEGFECFWNAYHDPDDDTIAVGPSVSDPQVSVAVNDPVLGQHPIGDRYIAALSRAKHTIRISSAYFAPPWPLYEAIIAAADRGVRIEIMVPEKSDVVYADWGARGLFADLMEHGVSIWLYRKTVNHSKTCTIDGHWSTIGSANLDYLSLQRNYEINAFVEDETFAQQMERMWDVDLQTCRRLDPHGWAQRSWLQRFLEVAVLPLYRFL